MRSEENRDFVKYHYYFPPFVSSVVEGGPAERYCSMKALLIVLAVLSVFIFDCVSFIIRCGLKAGDVILTINDKVKYTRFIQ